MTLKESIKALHDLQGYFALKRLAVWAPHLGLDHWQQMVAVQALCGGVIQMSLLTHLFLPEDLVSETLLYHASLLPRLEKFKVSAAPLIKSLSAKGSHGFRSLRSLGVPNENLLLCFLSYSIPDLKVLKVRGMGQRSLVTLARRLPDLREVYIEGTGFSSPEIFVLGACFQLEEIEIRTQDPLEMEDLELDRFRAMFRNLCSLSIAIRDN